MKTKVAVLIAISLLLVSCVPTSSTQETEVDVVETTTQEVYKETPTAQETALPQEPVSTESPTIAPTKTSLACVTLLTPVNGAEIPPVGKVTFSWTPMDRAGKYVLSIILPSGNVVPFETDQTFRDRYMEAFTAGGQYQWQVIAQDKDGNEICVSEFAKFEKSAYQPPKNVGNDGSNGSNDNNNGTGGGGTCWDGSTPDPVDGCPPVDQ